MQDATFAIYFSRNTLKQKHSEFKKRDLPFSGIRRAFVHTQHDHSTRNNLYVEYREDHLVRDDVNEASVSEYHVTETRRASREREMCVCVCNIETTALGGGGVENAAKPDTTDGGRVP